MSPFLRKGPRTYLSCSFLFSYVLWFLAWILAADDPALVLLNEGLVRALLFGDPSSPRSLGLSLLALAAVYGPLLGAVVATIVDRDTNLRDLARRTLAIHVPARWYLTALGILALTWLVPLALLFALPGTEPSSALAPAQIATFVAVFLLFQLLTSGLEEVGWRGYLLEKVLPGRTLWDAGWLVGIPWALWHFPIVIFMFLQQGMAGPQLVGSLVGFSIGIVGMSILHTWFYRHTRSVFLSILIHAAFNTFPLTTGMLFEASYAAALASQLLLWAVVIVVVQREERRTAPPEVA